MSEKRKILLVYDKECPACNNYCQLVRIRGYVGELVLVDARDESNVRKEITAKGWDIDQGMVLKVGEEHYYGSDAIHALALLSSKSGIFNRINYWAFKSRTISKWIYPVLRFFRNVLLKMLGKTKINNLNKPNNEKF